MTKPRRRRRRIESETFRRQLAAFMGERDAAKAVLDEAERTLRVFLSGACHGLGEPIEELVEVDEAAGELTFDGRTRRKR